MMESNTLIGRLTKEKETYNKGMWTVQEEVKTALATLKLSEDLFRQLNSADSKQLVAKAKAKYVLGNPRTWWLSLKLPFKQFEYDFPSENLIKHVPKGEEKCYWIPETEEDELIVYETYLHIIPHIMELSSAFEYYVVSRKVNWLLIETDHSQLIVIAE